MPHVLRLVPSPHPACADAQVSRRSSALTELEAYLLAQVARHAPVTAYDLRALLMSSPVATISSSAASVYPIVRRLKARGLLTSERVTGDGRRTERLRATPSGLEATRAWLARIEVAHLLLPDPLRSRIIFLELLPPADRLAWLRELRRALTTKLHELEAHRDKGADIWDELATINARGQIEARLAWVERAIVAVTEP